MIGTLSNGLALAAAIVPAPELELVGDPRAGHLRVQWTSPADPSRFQLQAASSKAFTDARVVYEGEHRASVQSGLRDGAVVYRVRSKSAYDERWGPWSEPAIVEISHYSPTFTWALFGTGAFVFVVTLGYLVHRARRLHD